MLMKMKEHRSGKQVDGFFSINYRGASLGYHSETSAYTPEDLGYVPSVAAKKIH